MKILITNIILAAVCALALAACSTNESVYFPEPDPTPGTDPKVEIPHSVLVYMVANNNLGSRNLDRDDINEMKQAMLNDQYPEGSRLIVYHAPYSGTPRLIEITKTGAESVLASYDSSETSVSIARMNKVISDFKEKAPSGNYGLVLWSHGTGWLEDTGTYDDPDLQIAPLSFGVDGNKKMSVPALAQGIGDNSFSFIYFDCCLMGTVEVIYELRNCAPAISASATELPLEGMPYNLTVPHLLKGDINSAAKATYNFYESGQGSECSCAIGVYKTDGLSALAQASRAIISQEISLPESYAPVPYFRTSVVPTGAYDMGDYFRNLPVAQNELSAFNQAYSNVVTNCYATSYSYGLNMENFTGLGCNIFTSATDSRLNYGYKNLKWFEDVASQSPYFTLQ